MQFATAERGFPSREDIRRWIKRALTVDAVVTVRFVGMREGRALHAQYRNRDYATNVLSFTYDVAPNGESLMGDIVICVPVLKREAKARQKSVRAHCAHLLVHGVLHLQGYDHESVADAKKMESLERRIMNTLGFSDPYRIVAQRNLPPQHSH